MALRCECRSAKTSKSSNEEHIASIDRLPHEVQLRILVKLPILSLLQCKLVSKLWYAWLKEPINTTMHLNHAIWNNDQSLIIFWDCPQYKLQLIADIGSARNGNPEIAKVLNMPLLSAFHRFFVVGSSHGLVCLIGDIQGYCVCICNPFTTECRAFPKRCVKSQKKVCQVVFGFGYDLVTMKYKFVEIIHYEVNNRKFVEAFITTFGSPGGRKNIGNIPYILFGPNSEAEVDGKLHWRTKTLQQEQSRFTGILSLDLTTEEFRVVPRPSCGSLDNADYHLVTLQGCLSAVVSWQDRHEVWTMKDYNIQASWTKHFVIVDLCLSFMRDIAPPGIRLITGRRPRTFQVLCSLKNGEILILYSSKRLICCNPETGEFRNLNIQKLPAAFLAYAHVGSLISLDTIFGIQGGK